MESKDLRLLFGTYAMHFWDTTLDGRESLSSRIRNFPEPWNRGTRNDELWPR